MGKIRLDKYLADMGLGTRTEVKKDIKKGRISVNGEIIKSPEYKIDTQTDAVLADGKEIAYEELVYYMLNKPQGVVSATEDRRDKTVLDLISEKKRKDLFPVGRLDKDTEGLLLITNDGELAHNLLAPKKHVDKKYFVRLKAPLSEENRKRLEEGVDIGEDKLTLPAQVFVLNEERDEAEIIIREGKFHQIKRMFHAVGNEVVFLKRLSMGSLVLDEALLSGEYRLLTPQEIERLKENA
ncbi:MAG: pseudouridine synthase [Bacillota bacterium]|nr:pseudouridine synthase [Bacillota bacterium]